MNTEAINDRHQGKPPEPEPKAWVVLAINPEQVIVVGNAYGAAITKEGQADRLRDQLEEAHGSVWNFLTLPITTRKQWSV